MLQTGGPREKYGGRERGVWVTSKIPIGAILLLTGATRYRGQITVDDGELEQFGTVQSVPSPDGL